MNYLSLIGRSDVLFTPDISAHEKELRVIISRSRFLIIGGSGSIGQAITQEVFRRDPKVLHVVDISENNMVELVRDIIEREPIIIISPWAKFTASVAL